MHLILARRKGRFYLCRARLGAGPLGCATTDLTCTQKEISTMARRKTLAELKSELDSANDYIESLEEKLDDIAGIATDEDDEDEDDDDEEEDEDSGE